jgi:hypothetical protein
MHASKKTKLIQKKTRINIRKKKSRIKERNTASFMKREMMLLQKNEGIEVAIKKSLECKAFLVSYHEVGHFVVKSKLVPNHRYIMRLKGSGNSLSGDLITEGSHFLDSFEVMAPVSIAGVIAETFKKDDQLNHSYNILIERLEHRPDREKFTTAWNDKFINTPKPEKPRHLEFYKDQYPIVLSHLYEYGFIEMFNLAWNLTLKRYIHIRR